MGVRFCVFALCLCVLTSCGGSSSTTGNLRFVQASPDAPLVSVYDNRKLIAANLSYKNNSGYFSLRSGDHLRVLPATGPQPIFQAAPSIASSANETLIMTGPAANLTSILLTDGGRTAVTGEVNVRVVNASQAIGAPDVYIVAAGTSITGLSPTVSGLAFNSSAGYDQVPIGSYEVLITTAKTRNIQLDTGPIGLSSGSQTVVALDGTSGGFTFALLNDQ